MLDSVISLDVFNYTIGDFIQGVVFSGLTIVVLFIVAFIGFVLWALGKAGER